MLVKFKQQKLIFLETVKGYTSLHKIRNRGVQGL
jgi:hypothetical protein